VKREEGVLRLGLRAERGESAHRDIIESDDNSQVAIMKEVD